MLTLTPGCFHAKGDDEVADRKQHQAERLFVRRRRLLVALAQKSPRANKQRRQQDDGDGIDALEVRGGHRAAERLAVGLLFCEIGQGSAGLLKGRPEEDDEKRDDVDDPNALSFDLC